MTQPKSDMRCKNHPEFDPYNKNAFKVFHSFRDCSVCCGLKYGADPIYHRCGENLASSIDIWWAKTKTGPLNLEQLGHIRFTLSFYWYHNEETLSYYIDSETMVIYFKEKPENMRRLIELQKEYGFEIHTRGFWRNWKKYG